MILHEIGLCYGFLIHKLIRRCIMIGKYPPFIFQNKKSLHRNLVQGILSYSVVYGNKAITLARLIATVRAL